MSGTIMNREVFEDGSTRPLRALNEGTGQREVFPVVTDAERALIRAQSGPVGGTSFSAFPSCFLTRIDSHLFRVLLLRRLQLPLSLAPRLCRCGRPLDPCGHHRAACAVSGVLGRRGFRCGVGSSTDLPRRRGACDHEQDEPRHGFGSSHH